MGKEGGRGLYGVWSLFNPTLELPQTADADSCRPARREGGRRPTVGSLVSGAEVVDREGGGVRWWTEAAVVRMRLS
jgi:hypothetical protein